MTLGKVVGTVVASQKEATLEGLRLLLVRACDFDGKPSGSAVMNLPISGS